MQLSEKLNLANTNGGQKSEVKQSGNIWFTSDT